MYRSPRHQARKDTVVKNISERDPLSYEVPVRESFKYEVEFNDWSINNATPSCPLFKRAWCFQERLLPTRVLHFLRDEVGFECNSGRRCECGEWRNDDYGQKAQYTQLWAEKEKLAHTMEGWKSILSKYTGRKLTYQRDMLPALSGVASHIQTSGLGR